jgi:transposase InsO family protein
MKGESQMKDSSFFDLNEEELEEIQDKYALLESLVDEYLTTEQKQQQAQEVRQKLQISERTLRRYLQRMREQGAQGLTRKKRADAGQMRVFSPQILRRAQELLKQNPARSIPILMELLGADRAVGEQVQKISPSTLYYHLKQAGHKFRGRREQPSGRLYHRFEAAYPNQLWQGDARHGIPLPHPTKAGKRKMTYLFAWIDDFSRKIIDARYYWDEKLPRMSDSYRRGVLRWGLSERLYCDNGKVYLSKHFLILVNDLGVKKIHHPAYSAWCKGKVECLMKTFKRFQSEAHLAAFRTIEELNSALAAWIAVEYNNKSHSSTGETPNERWRNNLAKHPPRRIKDLDAFNALFLWRIEKTIDKFGKIRFQSNSYRIRGLPVGTNIQLRYNPFDLAVVKVYQEGDFYCDLKAFKLSRKSILKVPEERKQTIYSPEAAEYFKRIRDKANELKRRQAEQMRYSDLGEKEEQE